MTFVDALAHVPVAILMLWLVIGATAPIWFWPFAIWMFMSTALDKEGVFFAGLIKFLVVLHVMAILAPLVLYSHEVTRPVHTDVFSDLDGR